MVREACADEGLETVVATSAADVESLGWQADYVRALTKEA